MLDSLDGGHHIVAASPVQKPVLTEGVAKRLEDMLSIRRSQSDNIVGIVKKVIDRLKLEVNLRVSAEAQAAKWQSRCEELECELVNQQKVFEQDYAKLSEGYKVVVSAVEEARISGTKMGDRIDGILLNYDLNLGRDPSISPSSHVRNFTEKAFGYQPYPLNPIDIIERVSGSLDTSPQSGN